MSAQKCDGSKTKSLVPTRIKCRTHIWPYGFIARLLSTKPSAIIKIMEIANPHAMPNNPGCTEATINSAANANPAPAQILVVEFLAPLRSLLSQIVDVRELPDQ
ncbi:MAG: hypothetical protein WAK55_28365, partial [Xanthobacteraceae bacterium]